MNLNEIAESDLEYTLEDVETGFGVSLIFKDSGGSEVSINCGTTDIGFFLDPQTGVGVQSRTVEISGRITTFENNDIPIEKDAIVKYYDTNENEYKTSIRQIIPDRKLGIYRIKLEARE